MKNKEKKFNFCEKKENIERSLFEVENFLNNTKKTSVLLQLIKMLKKKN